MRIKEDFDEDQEDFQKRESRMTLEYSDQTVLVVVGLCRTRQEDSQEESLRRTARLDETSLLRKEGSTDLVELLRHNITRVQRKGHGSEKKRKSAQDSEQQCLMKSK